MHLVIRNRREVQEWNNAAYMDDSKSDIHSVGSQSEMDFVCKVGEKNQIKKRTGEIPHLQRTNPSV
jgi:hypothetical protein